MPRTPVTLDLPRDLEPLRAPPALHAYAFAAALRPLASRVEAMNIGLAGQFLRIDPTRNMRELAGALKMLGYSVRREGTVSRSRVWRRDPDAFIPAIPADVHLTTPALGERPDAWVVVDAGGLYIDDPRLAAHQQVLEATPEEIDASSRWLIKFVRRGPGRPSPNSPNLASTIAQMVSEWVWRTGHCAEDLGPNPEIPVGALVQAALDLKFKCRPHEEGPDVRIQLHADMREIRRYRTIPAPGTPERQDSRKWSNMQIPMMKILPSWFRDLRVDDRARWGVFPDDPRWIEGRRPGDPATRMYSETSRGPRAASPRPADYKYPDTIAPTPPARGKGRQYAGPVALPAKPTVITPDVKVLADHVYDTLVESLQTETNADVIARLRASLANAIPARDATKPKPRYVPADPAPIYDEVFEQGVQALNQDAGEPIAYTPTPPGQPEGTLPNVITVPDHVFDDISESMTRLREIQYSKPPVTIEITGLSGEAAKTQPLREYIQVQVVVNGNDDVIYPDADDTLAEVVKYAIAAAGAARPFEDWEMRSEDGTLLDLSEPASKYQATKIDDGWEGPWLYLCLKIGAGASGNTNPGTPEPEPSFSILTGPMPSSGESQ